jgi:hypothetical protein
MICNRSCKAGGGKLIELSKVGGVVGAPSKMATEVIFLNDQEIEVLVEKALGHPLPWPLFNRALRPRDAESQGKFLEQTCCIWYHLERLFSTLWMNQREMVEYLDKPIR